MFVWLPWLLSGYDRPEYAKWQARDCYWEAGQTGRLLLALIAARFTFNALLRGPLNRLAARRGDTPHHQDGSKLLEECWVSLGNSAMLVGALYVSLYRNGGCWFGDTRACLAGWPNLEVDPAVLFYYHVELAWYLHMLLKPVLRYGLRDGRDMLIHHAATLALILVSYGTNQTRFGVMVLGVYSMSNPLLHIAKVCNQLSLGPLKMGGFAAFALVFFVSRIILVPLSILKPALFDSRRDIPHVCADFAPMWWLFNSLLGLLYLMQLLWFRGILRVLGSLAKHGAQAASNMSAQVDPAKRYAGAPAAQPAESASGSDSDRGRDGGGGAKQRRAPAGQQPKTPSPVDPPLLAAARKPEGSGETAKAK